MAERLIGMLIFPRLTQLDMTGPYEVLARLPNTKVHLVAHTHGAGEDRPRHGDRADRDLRRLSAARSRHGAGRSRPAGPDGRRGGAGIPAASRRAGAKYVTSVCTGSLVLGAAGLLKGKRATCHWAAIEHLKPLGAIPVSERVVMDGNIITGAGVASGHRFRAGGRGGAGRRGGGAADPVADRVRSGAAVQLRLAEDGVGRDGRAAAGAAARRSTSSGARWRSASARSSACRRHLDEEASWPFPTKLDHCVIHVSDWERSNAFYRDVMGAELVQRPVGWAYRFGDKQLNVHGKGVQPGRGGAAAGAARQQRSVLRMGRPDRGRDRASEDSTTSRSRPGR